MSISLGSILNEQDLRSVPINLQTIINCVLESKCKSLELEKQRSSLLEKDYNDLKTKVDYQSDLVNRYKGHIAQLEDDLHSSRRELCASNHEKDCLNVDLKNLNLELTSKDDELKKLNELVKTKNEEVVEMIEINHKLQMELEQKKIDTSSSDFSEQQIQNLLNQKESLYNLERNLLKEELEKITQDFHEKCLKFNSLSSEFTIYKNEAEVQLNDLKKEYNALKSQNTFLNNLIEKKDNQINDLAVKLNELHQHQDMLKEQFESQEKKHVDLINCYKNSLNESKVVKNELAEKIKELHSSFIESNENYKIALKKYNDQSIQFAEELRLKDDLNMELKQKTEDLELQLMAMNQRELDNSMKKFYPTSNTLSKMFEKNMPLSAVYTKYEELQEKYQELENENDELKVKIQELIAESENNVPLIFYKTQENKKACAEIEEYKTQFTKVSIDLENALSEIENYNKVNNYLKRELKRYEKSNIDLSRQVQCLIQTVHEIKGNFVSTKFLVNDQFLEKESSFDKAISLNLVTFKNIEEIHENNQKLLSSIRELSEKYSELQDKYKNRNDDEESKKHIDKLLLEIENLKEENRHKQEILSEMMNESESKLNQTSIHEYNICKDKQASGSTLFKITSRAYLEEKIAELTNNLEKQNTEFEQFKNQSKIEEDRLRAEIKNYVKEISEKQNEISKMTVRLESLEENNKLLDSKLTLYGKEKAMFKERNIKLEEQRKILKERISTFESKKNELIGKLNEMKKELDTNAKSSSLLEKENDHLKLENGMIKRRLEELMKEIKESKNELLQTKNEFQIGSIKNEYELKNQIQLLDMKNTNHQNTIIKLTNEKKELNEKLVETRNQSRNQIQQLRQKMISLTTENHSAIQEKNRILAQFKECQDKLKEIEQLTDDSAVKTKMMKTHLELRNQLEDKNKEIVKLTKEQNDLIEKLKLKESILRKANQVNSQQIEMFEKEVKNRVVNLTKQLEESSLREKILKNGYEARLKNQDKELTELRQFKQQTIAANEYEIQQQTASFKPEQQSAQTVSVFSHKPNTATIKPITVHNRLQQTVATTLPQAAVTPTQTISNIISPQTAYVVPTSVEQTESANPPLSASQASTSFSLTSSTNIQESTTSIIQQNIISNQPLSEQQHIPSDNNNLKRQRMISFEDLNIKKQKLNLIESDRSNENQFEIAKSTPINTDQESMQVIEQQLNQEELRKVIVETDNQNQVGEQIQPTFSGKENVIEIEAALLNSEAQEEMTDQENQKIDEKAQKQNINEEMIVEKCDQANELIESKDENNRQEEESGEEDEQIYEEDEEGSEGSGAFDEDEENSEYDGEVEENSKMQTNNQSKVQDKDQSSDIICLSGDEDQVADENTIDSKTVNDELNSERENINGQEESDQAAASLGFLMNADFYPTNFQQDTNQQQISSQQEDTSSDISQQPKNVISQPGLSMPIFTDLDRSVALDAVEDQNINYDNLIIDEQASNEQLQDQNSVSCGLVNFESSNPITSEQTPISTSKSIFSNISASNQETNIGFLQGQSTTADQGESSAIEKTNQSKKHGKLRRPIISTKTIQHHKDKPSE